MLYKLKNQKLEEFIPITFNQEGNEKMIEEWILNNPEIIFKNEDILFIQREKPITKEPDLLGLDKERNLVLIEIKRGVTPREVIAQTLDYASDLAEYNEGDLNEIAKDYFKKDKIQFTSLREVFIKKFNETEEENVKGINIVFNQNQRIVIFAERIDEDTQKMVSYLNRKSENISCIEFTYYRSGDEIMIEINPVIVSGFNITKSEIGYNPTKKAFWDMIAEKMYPKLDTTFKNVSFRYKHSSGSIFQLPIPRMGATHFEFWIRKNNRFEISLHLEDPITRDKLYKFLKAKEQVIKSKLGQNVNVETWGKKDENEPLGKKYKRVGEIIEYSNLDSQFADEVVNRMIEFINILKPMLEEATKIN